LEQAANALNWGVVLILLPLAGALLVFSFRRAATIIGIGAALATSLAAAGMARAVIMDGTWHHAVGGWGAPLGIDLRADGLSVLMLLMTAAVGLAIGFYAPAYFRDEPRKAEQFWPLWLFLWTGLNALFLSADIFNLYVTLELLGLAAVALTALSGRADALTGAMRYSLATLLGSLAYLPGVALLYHGFGSVDIATLAERVEASPVVWAALGLMCAGLLLKTALFPLHFWLPPAHASAPAPVSALLSAMFLAAGNLLRFGGHDRIADLDRVVRSVHGLRSWTAPGRPAAATLARCRTGTGAAFPAWCRSETDAGEG